MEEVRRIRKERGLTQDQLAELANIDRAGLSLIESGQRPPKVDTLEKLAGALGVEVADFFPRSQPDLFTGAPEGLAPTLPVEFVHMSRATIDRAIGTAERWREEGQDQEMLAAYIAFLHALRAEAAPLEQRAILVSDASIATAGAA
jgi:transcriptional regulator with XRE-family HTH domain